jgi:hypothetical protein
VTNADKAMGELASALANTQFLQALVEQLGTRATLKLFHDADYSFHVPAPPGAAMLRSDPRCWMR